MFAKRKSYDLGIFAAGLAACLCASPAFAQAPAQEASSEQPARAAFAPAYPQVPVKTQASPPWRQAEIQASKDASCSCGEGCEGDSCGSPLFRWFRSFRQQESSRERHPVYEPEMLGASVYSHLGMQVDNGLALELVFHHFDFHNEPGTDRSQLNAYGLRRLRKIAPLLSSTYRPIIVEETIAEPELDEARRQRVIQSLAQMSLAVSPNRVVVAPAPGLGLDGGEALEIYGNMLLQTRNGPRGAATRQSGGTGLIGVSGSGVESGN